MTGPLAYALAGAALFGLGAYGMLARSHILRRVMALNVAGSGVFLVLIAFGRRGEVVDPVPSALVLTGIVITVAATAVALGLGRRMVRPEGSGGERH